jgi:AbrB family transcriptional regulator (stage V sporulation protein T)
MKATGIVRRIDDLGRIVIPKEIRRTMRIRERDALEIFTDRDGEVILKKYSPIANLEDFAQEYAESLFEATGHVTLILDRDTYIAAAGTSKKPFLESSSKLSIPGFEDTSQMMVPIIHEGDVVGAVILVSRDKSLGELEQTLCQTAADFLAKQLG